MKIEIKKNSLILLNIFISATILICSCGGESSSEKNNHNNVDTLSKTSDYQPKIFVLELLKTVRNSQLPAIINTYLIDTSKVKASLINNKTIKFFVSKNNEYKQVKVHLFEYENDLQFFGISYFESDSINFSSYFYFIKKEDEKWRNITIEILPYFAIQVIRLEENIDIKFKKPNNKIKFSAYFSKNNKSAVNLLFDNESFKIEKLTKNNFKDKIVRKAILDFNYKEEKFSVRKIVDGNSCSLLNYNELYGAKRFTDVQKACADSSEAYILDLSDKEISNFPDEIMDLKRLQILILNDNTLSNIPLYISEIKNLQILRVNGNKIKYIPKEISKLLYLEELSLENNNITRISPEFYNLKKIKVVNLRNNQISTINSKVSNLKFLASLNISSNNLTFLPASIGKLSNLRLLNISNNNINSLPPEINNLTNLKTLVIKNTLLTSEKIEKIIKMLPNTEIIF